MCDYFVHRHLYDPSGRAGEKENCRMSQSEKPLRSLFPGAVFQPMCACRLFQRVAVLPRHALGMCIALVTEWNAFKPGVAFGVADLLFALITVFVWRRGGSKKAQLSPAIPLLPANSLMPESV